MRSGLADCGFRCSLTATAGIHRQVTCPESTTPVPLGAALTTHADVVDARQAGRLVTLFSGFNRARLQSFSTSASALSAGLRRPSRAPQLLAAMRQHEVWSLFLARRVAVSVLVVMRVIGV
jgi:hypothetical protein